MVILFFPVSHIYVGYFKSRKPFYVVKDELGLEDTIVIL